MAAKSVIVVGAGIVGASIAWHLTRAGARVRVIDPTGPGGRATPLSWAWINASWGNSEPYFRLRVRSMADWADLAATLPDVGVKWSGGLLWDLTEDKLRAYVAEQSSWGYDVRLIDGAEVARLEPAVRNPPDLAAHAPHEGAVEPAQAAAVLIHDATERGTEVTTGQTVAAVEMQGDRATGVRLDDGTALEADHVVLAAGAETATLARTAGVTLPVDAPPGLLIHTHPLPPLLNGLVMMPELHVRQTAEGQLLVGTDFGGTDPGTDPQGAAADLMASLSDRIGPRSGPPLRYAGHTVGYRPTPVDGVSIVGEAVPGLSVAVTHSGVTLAPVIGRLLAEEIVDGRMNPLLASFRPGRFDNTTT